MSNCKHTTIIIFSTTRRVICAYCHEVEQRESENVYGNLNLIRCGQNITFVRKDGGTEVGYKPEDTRLPFGECLTEKYLP